MTSKDTSKATTSTTIDHERVLANYNKLFPIKEKVTDEQRKQINIIRQLINEEFVSPKKQITNQQVYNLVKEFL